MVNREIKFRAWDGKDMYLSPDEPWALGAWFDSHANTLKKDDVEFMQFTGLKDKNGVEIYEGDLVRNPDGVSPVEYQSDAYYLPKLNQTLLWYGLPELEVIGNIYQNPELASGNPTNAAPVPTQEKVTEAQ